MEMEQSDTVEIDKNLIFGLYGGLANCLELGGKCAALPATWPRGATGCSTVDPPPRPASELTPPYVASRSIVEAEALRYDIAEVARGDPEADKLWQTIDSQNLSNSTGFSVSTVLPLWMVTKRDSR